MLHTFAAENPDHIGSYTNCTFKTISLTPFLDKKKVTSPEDTKKNGCEKIVLKHWYHFYLPSHRNGRAIGLFV